MDATAPQHKAPGVSGNVVTVCAVFLAVCASAVAACVGGVASSEGYSSFVEIENTYRLLMAAELFFVMFLWPLSGAKRGAMSVPVLSALLVTSAPLVLIAAWVSNVPGYTIVLTHLLLLAVAAACVGTCKLIARRGERYWRHYYLWAAVLAGGLPLMQFLMLDLAGKGLRWLSCIAPFWAMELAQQPGQDGSRLLWALAVLIFAGIAAAAQKL